MVSFSSVYMLIMRHKVELKKKKMHLVLIVAKLFLILIVAFGHR